jgi:hypothetical protein
MNTIVKVGLAAGGAYVAYQMGWLSSFGFAPAPAASAGTPPVSPAKAPPVAAAPSNTLDGLYAKLVAAAGAPSALGVDAWGYYLNQILADAKLGAAPDPVPVFSLGSDRSQLFPAAEYWAKMAPALKSQYGLSGLGPKGFGWMAGWR